MVSVKTRTGILDGTLAKNGVCAFLGIPYAEQPVRELRWKPPVALPDSGEHLDCTEFGHSSIQEEDEYEAASMHEQGEDCLCLNVWTRSLDKKQKPVMVYIHGGAFISGGSADPLYNGANFAERHDVVIVTINYRVGFLASLALYDLPGGEEYKEAGRLNTMDQVAALTWVHENIDAFGGDPNNVTLFGESAGSASAALLSVCPAAKGLFQKAICESGPIDLYSTPSFKIPWAHEFMEVCGCKTVQEMVSLPIEKLAAARDAMSERHPNDISLIYSPECDGSYLPELPFKAWKDGAAKDITFMIGSTNNEFSYFELYLDHEDMPDFWREQCKLHFDGNIDVRTWEDRFFGAHPEMSLLPDYLDFMNNSGFFVTADLMADCQSRFNDVYCYRFCYESRNQGLGACHAIEVPFVMENLDTPDGLAFTGPNPPKKLADEMNDAWFAFASTGNPSTVHSGAWPVYHESNRIHMVMDENGWSAKKDLNLQNHELLLPMFDALIA